MTHDRRRTFAATLLAVATLPLGLALALTNASGINTLLIGLGSCMLAVPLGTLLGFLLTRTDLPARRLGLALFAVLLFVPLYLQAAGWDAGFGRMGWQGSGGRIAWLSGLRAVIWIHAMAGLPWVVLIVAAGMQTVNSAAEEAGLLVGSKWQVLWHISLRRVGGAILIASLWVAVTVVTESTVADIYAVPMFARNVFVWASGLQQRLSPWDIGFGTCLLAFLVFGCLVLLTRIGPHEQITPMAPPPRFTLRRARLPCLLIVWFVLAATITVPVANLVIQAGEESFLSGSIPTRVWSITHFVETIALTMRRFSGELRWTVLIAATAATLSCCVALLLAWASRRNGLLHRMPAICCTVIGLALPAPLIAQFVIWLLNRDDPGLLRSIVGENAAMLRWLYDRSILAPTLAVSFRCLPATIIVLWFAFQSIGKDQLETATLDGAGPLRRLVQIAVPQRLFSLAAAWWIAFAIASGDVTASILVLPPGIDTVSVRVFGLLHAGVDEQVAGLCLVSAVGYVLIGSLIYLFARRWFGGNRTEPQRLVRL